MGHKDLFFRPDKHTSSQLQQALLLFLFQAGPTGPQFRSAKQVQYVTAGEQAMLAGVQAMLAGVQGHHQQELQTKLRHLHGQSAPAPVYDGGHRPPHRTWWPQ